MKHDYILWRHFMKTHRLADRFAGQVHKRLRLKQKKIFLACRGSRESTFEFLPPRLESPVFGETGHPHHKTDIVAGTSMFDTGIT